MVNTTNVSGLQSNFQSPGIGVGGVFSPSGDTSAETGLRGFVPQPPTMARPGFDWASAAAVGNAPLGLAATKKSLGKLLQNWQRQAVGPEPKALDFSQVPTADLVPEGWRLLGRVANGEWRPDVDRYPSTLTCDVSEATLLELTCVWHWPLHDPGTFDAAFKTASGDSEVSFTIAIANTSLLLQDSYFFPDSNGRLTLRLERTPKGVWRCNGKRVYPTSAKATAPDQPSVVSLGYGRAFWDRFGIERVAIR
jgi:hypothetical protein